MRISVTPAVRLSLGLVILTLSILILAQALGLTPDTKQQQVAERQQFSETLGLQALLAIKRNDEQLLQATLNNAVARNPQATSAAVRRFDGSLVAYTDRHPDLWPSSRPQKSTPRHIYVPLLMNGAERGALEISFASLSGNSNNFLRLPNFVLLALFVCISSFVGFWLFIKRALHHLDPNAVVPARVRNALNILAEGVLILDKREQIVLINNTLSQRLDVSEQSLIGRKASSLGWEVSSDQPVTQLPWLEALGTGERQVGVRLTLSRNRKPELIFRVNAVPILDNKGNSQGTIASFDDVSELEEKNRQLNDMVTQLARVQKAIELKNRELEYLASRDPMTDCYNRRALREQLDVEFQKARQSNRELSCIMTDIDHFKRVNDTYGHGLGDDVIRMVSAKLKELVRDGDIVARFGGEEFCIILPSADIEQAKVIADRCREEIAAAQCNGIKVTSSFGISSIRLGAETPNALIQKADEALYYSKQNGRNKVSLWHSDMINVMNT